MKQSLLFLGSILVGAILLPIFFLIFPLKFNQALVSPNPSISKSDQIASFSAEIAPSDSLRGNMTNLSGDVLWQSRIATEPAKLSEKKMIQQGESLKTAPDGKVAVDFSGTIVTLLANSEVNFAQTLPTNIVLVQKMGPVDYQKMNAKNLSIRALHLLVEPQSGEIGIAVDMDKHTVALNALKGGTTVAFNDSNNISTVLSIPEGKQYFFDDDLRTGKIK